MRTLKWVCAGLLLSSKRKNYIKNTKSILCTDGSRALIRPCREPLLSKRDTTLRATVSITRTQNAALGDERVGEGDLNGLTRKAISKLMSLSTQHSLPPFDTCSSTCQTFHRSNGTSELSMATFWRWTKWCSWSLSKTGNGSSAIWLLIAPFRFDCK